MENIRDLFNNFLNKTMNGTVDSDQHLVTLFGITLQIKAKKILELGVRWGTTTEPMIAGVFLNQGHITCVDVSPTEWVCPDALKPYYTFVHSDAIKFLEQEVEKQSYYDMIYIDDWHSAPHVKRELELVDKLTDNKSIILLHDLMGMGTQPEYYYPINEAHGEWALGGPYAAVKDLDLNKWEWATIPVNNGLTILRKK